MAQQQIFEGTGAEIANLVGKLSRWKRYRLVEIEESQNVPAPKPTENFAMIAALQEIAERQKGRRDTDGSQTDQILRDGRAGAIWGHELVE